MARINLKAAAVKAKKIRKAHPSMKWNNAMAQAMRSMSGKSKTKKRRVGSTRPKKKAARKSIIRRVKILHKAEGRAIKALGSVASHVSRAKKILEHEIGKLETRKFVAKKKSVKRKIAKVIAMKKSKFRKLC
jgi:hypothetical protein